MTVTVDLEVQRSDNDDHQRGARYNGACLTTNISDPGIYFKEIPDVTVIFITKNDFMGKGSLIYHIERVDRQREYTGNNGFREIYVNAAHDDGSRLASMMKIFVEDSYYDVLEFPHLSRWKRHFKTEGEGVERMSTILEELRNEAREEGREEGLKEGLKEGHTEGLAEGRESTLLSLVRDGLISAGEAAKRLGKNVAGIVAML